MIKRIGIRLFKINSILIIVFFLLWTIPFTFAINHYLIVDNYDYYTQAKSEWSKDKSILHRIYMNALDLKLRRDWKSYALKEIDKSSFSDLEKAKFAIILTKSINADIPHLPVPQSLFGSIIHGYGHCDELNGTVAFIMHGMAKKSELYALWDKENKRSKHSVAKVETDEMGVFYLDAYKKNTPYFGIKEELTKKGQTILPLYDDVSKDLGLSKQLYLDGKTLSSYTFLYQVKKAFNRINSMVKSDKEFLGSFFSSILGIKSIYANDLEYGNRDTINHSILKMYVSARVHHIYGRLNTATDLYKQIINTDCIMNECKASAEFYKRLF
jgi:hypothetical protein